MPNRNCFLRFFAILLAILAGFAIAVRLGAPQAIWLADASMMTSAIGLLFAVTLVRIGLAAWDIDPLDVRGRSSAHAAVEFGHLAVRLSVMFGFVGTAIGLSMQASALASAGAASLGALSTSLYTTATGGVAAALIEMVTFNLEASQDA